MKQECASCQLCTIARPRAGETTVIIKSDIGRSIYYGALRSGFIVENPKSPNMRVIERLSSKKMEQGKTINLHSN